jgi:hypothetical protein
MPKEKKYRRRGKKHEDSSYRKSGRSTHSDEFSIGQTKRLVPGLEPKLGGPRYPIDFLMMTKRGKRIHYMDGDVDSTSKESPKGIKDIVADKDQWYKLSAKCGAGRPNKEFPKGSAIPLVAKLPKNLSDTLNPAEIIELSEGDIRVTCYKCLKVLYIQDIADKTDGNDNELELYTRDFFPTDTENNRHKHVMVPQGRNGQFGSVRGKANRAGIWNALQIDDDNGTITNYYEYFDKSKWVPGIEEARTQPKSLVFIGNRTPAQIAKLLEVEAKRESFGQLIKDVLGANVYYALDPVGNSMDTDDVFEKLANLYMLRRDLAERNYKNAQKRAKASRQKNPLLDLDQTVLDGLDLFIRRHYVQTKR